MYVLTKILIIFTTFVFIPGSATVKKTGYGPGEQDWGWVEVRKGAHMFFWLYYTTAKVDSFYERPLVVWLQGGPGGSSTGYGNFAEIGPLHINGSEREYAWTKEVNVLFIDNPVGAGFSYVDDYNLLTKNNIQIGNDMITFFEDFYEKYSEFKKVPLYIFSESYGGKMAVEIGKQLDEKIKGGKLNVNLKAVGLIDSWISPIDSVLGWSPLLLNTGLIDERDHNKITASAVQIKKLIDNGKYKDATAKWGSLEYDIVQYTRGIDFYNILSKISVSRLSQNTLTPSPEEQLYRTQLNINEDVAISNIMNGPVRKALNIPDKIIHGKQRNRVFETLKEDFMKPVTHVVEHLLNNTDIEVIVMSGQLDLIVDTYGTLHWVDNLRWNGSNDWAKANREPLVIKNIIEGFVSKAKNLVFYWVNRAGHMIPKDSPEPSMEILRRVTQFDSKTKEY